MFPAAVFTAILALASALPQGGNNGAPSRYGSPCTVQRQASLEYVCLYFGEPRRCDANVPHGGVVTPVCRHPQYNITTMLADMYCLNGQWNYVAKCMAGSPVLPQSPQTEEPSRLNSPCILQPHASVDYNCLVGGRSRQCGSSVQHGGVVKATCKQLYYTSTTLKNMRCSHGQWDYIATCKPECGKITSGSSRLKKNTASLGTRPTQGAVPWYAAIYKKNPRPDQVICGGSLISATAVLTVAHCFWSNAEGQQPPENYAVTLGKTFRAWNDVNDQQAQFFNVREIHIPNQFQGHATNYIADIAVVMLDKEVVFQNNILPVCLTFDASFNSKQFQGGKLGKIAGWSLKSEGQLSAMLQVAGLPFVPFDQCYAESPSSFHRLITADKFCAGYLNGTTPCTGDGGSGLAFPDNDRGVQRYYLLGLASIAPTDDQGCYWYSAFTVVSQYENFLKSILSSE